MGFGVNQLDQMQQPPTPGKDSGNGKMGQQGVITNSATSEQPSIGAPNQYASTVGLGDNAQQSDQFKQLNGIFGKGQGQ